MNNLQEKKLEILKKRALALSLEKEENDTVEKTLEVLEFYLENERYAFESRYVKEVYPFKDCTPLPCVPHFIQGLINVRRRILSVVNLKKFFALNESDNITYSQIIILSYDCVEIAFLADLVIGISNIAVDNLQTSFPTITGIRQEFLKGITHDQLILLDGKLLLTDKKIIIE